MANKGDIRVESDCSVFAASNYKESYLAGIHFNNPWRIRMMRKVLFFQLLMLILVVIITHNIPY